jgi:hypothetical protein
MEIGDKVKYSQLFKQRFRRNIAHIKTGVVMKKSKKNIGSSYVRFEGNKSDLLIADILLEKIN